MGVAENDLGFEPLTPEFRAWLAIIAASVKRWTAIFTDFEGAHDWIADLEGVGAEYIRPMQWIRWSEPQLSGDRPPTGAETIIIAHRQHVGPRGGLRPLAKHWNGPGSRTHYSRRCMRGKDKHKTQKPIDLMLDLVSDYSDPGELVLDPVCGRGTTAQACRMLGRDCVAIERDSIEARRAASRVEGPIEARDIERAKEWCATTFEEASNVPTPSAADGSDVKTWERAQRRIADVERVLGALP
jgi:site-specific DNA-methyltransferase (adenine-specific)